jgi:hypothetical protein
MESKRDYLSRSLLPFALLAASGLSQAPQDREAAASSAQRRPANAAALFRAFAQIQGLSAEYTEEKFLSLLAIPLKSRGKLYFMQPGYLSRIVEAPEASKLTITTAELRMKGKGGEEVIDLRQSDRVRLFVTSLVQVFQGDQEALKQHYEIRYTPKPGDAHHWRLELQPRKKPLTQIMKRLILAGKDETVTRIELQEPNGDRTVTKIIKVDPKRVFTRAEQKDIFGVEAAPAKKPSKKRAPAAAGQIK